MSTGRLRPLSGAHLPALLLASGPMAPWALLPRSPPPPAQAQRQPRSSSSPSFSSDAHCHLLLFSVGTEQATQKCRQVVKAKIREEEVTEPPSQQAGRGHGPVGLTHRQTRVQRILRSVALLSQAHSKMHLQTAEWHIRAIYSARTSPSELALPQSGNQSPNSLVLHSETKQK